MALSSNIHATDTFLQRVLALSNIVSTTSSSILSADGLILTYSFQAVCWASRNQLRYSSYVNL